MKTDEVRKDVIRMLMVRHGNPGGGQSWYMRWWKDVMAMVVGGARISSVGGRISSAGW